MVFLEPSFLVAQVGPAHASGQDPKRVPANCSVCLSPRQSHEKVIALWIRLLADQSQSQSQNSTTSRTSASMTPLEFPLTLMSNCGEHEVLLKKFLQPFKFKVSSTDDEDEYYIAVFEGVYRGKLVVIKVYGSLAGCSGEQACVRAAREVRALRRLSKPSSPCPHAPTLRASFQANGSWSDRYPEDPDCQVIVMTKLPGRLIGEDILGDPDQYRRVAAAFKRALE